MSKTENGGPAFPQMRVWNAERAEYEDTQQYPGMSLRDYFAIHATDQDLIAFMTFGDEFLHPTSRTAARYAYADAMIAERAKDRA